MKKRIFVVLFILLFSLTIFFVGCVPDDYIDYNPDNKQDQDDGSGSGDVDDENSDDNEDSKKDDDKVVELPWVYF